jgi:hypothetical protein
LFVIVVLLRWPPVAESQLWNVRQHYAFMKKLVPYILAYLIVATCTAVYPYVYRHYFMRKMTETLPANTVALITNPGLSQAQLDAKLHQVGLSEFNPHTDKSPPPPSRPSRLYSLTTYHYIFDAVMLSVFAGLVILFRRIFQTVVPDRSHAAS